METCAELSDLLNLTNPHLADGCKYKTWLFMRQWKKQRKFQSTHTQEDNDIQLKLVKLYKDEAILDLLRNRLIGPEVFLATDDQANELLDNISQKLDQLKKDAELLNQTVLTAERLSLLLWDAKLTLFTHAVNLHAERQPVVNSQMIGARLGTKLKEKIFKAIQAQRPAINKSIAAFNKCYGNYIAKFPNQSLLDFSGMLTYKKFVALPLDNKFWNNGLYFHSKAPWAGDPTLQKGLYRLQPPAVTSARGDRCYIGRPDRFYTDVTSVAATDLAAGGCNRYNPFGGANVCAGINCVLILSRIQEDFQLIAQELAQAVGWAISHHAHLLNHIQYIQQRYDRLQRYAATGGFVSPEEEENHFPFNHIDDMHLGGIGRKHKMKMWHNLMGQIATRKASEAAVDEDVEEAAIDVGTLDGEDANNKWIIESDLTGLADNLAAL
ncbi:hypothetical protein PCANC_23999 [Puccinia coronata f. sp. avenae]|uniref:Uncharacterized protein n=1 Tax=Puccinia coronata f. sp. avenae TaxID=200324 RepID=A0A2N5TSA1_9BASI|nr:hypothetical protein PCANC_23999 [Puccinia coronata f. sp. avenae]